MTENNRRLPFPEAGEDAYVEFDLDALNALEEQFGAAYYETMQSAFAAFNIATLQKIAAVALHDGSFKTAMKKVTLKEMAEHLGDGLALFTHGCTMAELRQQRHEEMATIMMRAKIAEMIAAKELAMVAVAPTVSDDPA